MLKTVLTAGFLSLLLFMTACGGPNCSNGSGYTDPMCASAASTTYGGSPYPSGTTGNQYGQYGYTDPNYGYGNQTSQYPQQTSNGYYGGY